MSLTVEHHALLQFILAQRVTSEEAVFEFQRNVAIACGRAAPVDASATLDSMITVLNGALESVSLRIAAVVEDQATSRPEDDVDQQQQQQQQQRNRIVKFFAVVNTTIDEAIKFGTEFKPKELLYFRALIDKLVRDMSCTLVDALNIADLVDSFTKSDAESTLARLQSERWLHRSRAGAYSLGVRTVLELVPYIENQYGADSLTTCTICHAAVLRGAQCPTPNCSVRLHLHCALEWFSGRESSVCITCNGPWTSALPASLNEQIQAARRARQSVRAHFAGPVLDH